MNLRLLLASGSLLFGGAVLLLGASTRFTRPTLAERLRPLAPEPTPRTSGGALATRSLQEMLAPFVQTVGDAVSRIVGATDDLTTRLHRIHSPLDAAAFRLRQLGAASASFAAAVAVATMLQLGRAPSVLLLVLAPLAGALLVEHQLMRATSGRRRRLFLELPVVAEQLGMLLNAGYSQGSALDRLAQRGTGVVAEDLGRLRSRLAQGVAVQQALREWSELVQLPELDHLIAVLTFDPSAADLGRLAAEEARALRRETQRRQLELIERRGQQVWIPVTVAALVPGVLFISIPFIEAMRLFSGG